MKKKILFTIVAFIVSISSVKAEELKNGIITENGDKYYYLEGILQKGVQTIEDNNYYFNLEGKMERNVWIDIDNDEKYDYYFGEDYKAVDGVQLIDNKYYYFKDKKMQYGTSDGTYYYGNYSGTRQYNYWRDINQDGKYEEYYANDGKIVDGVQKIDNKYYYFKDKKMQYGTSDGTYYYGNYSGTRQYDYYWDENHDEIVDYYFNKDGIKEKNIWKDKNQDGKDDYYFGEDYKAVDGIQLIDEKYYFFKNFIKQYGIDDGTYYYGNYSGTRQYNYWRDINQDGKYEEYYANDGKIVDGVQKIDNKYYYFKDKKMQYGTSDGTYYYGNYSGTRQYDYYWDENRDSIIDYYFNEEGIKEKNIWKDKTKDGKDDYYFGEDYKAVDGIQLIDEKYYYFKDSIKQYGTTDGTYYYGNYSGTRQYNYWWDNNRDGKDDYYFDEEGKKVFGSQLINDKYYYFNENGKKQYGIFIEIDGKKYYYGNYSGTRQYGWLKHDNKVYYLHEETGEVITGKVSIDGTLYEFNGDGTWKAGWISTNGKTFYYYLDGSKAVGWVNIAGAKCFFNNNGELIQENALKIIDVSSHQHNIDWNTISNTDVDGAIIRVGYGTSYVTDAPVIDSYFNTNYKETLNKNLLFGTYIYSYAIDATSANIEADFVIKLLNQKNYDKNKIVFYDLEENPWTKNLTKNDYDIIISTFINKLASYGYKVKVYTYKFWAENKLSDYGRSQLGWIAQYNDNCTYNGSYSGWQYTSEDRINGISTVVDVSVFKK